MKKNKLICVLLCTVILLCTFSLSAFADTGPKPSVNIEITGIKGEYYATLLSKEKSTGPASAWDGTEEHKNYTNLDPVIWEKFTYYKDSDGFYFLQQAEKCYGNDMYKWGYYPPKTFKVLVYIPESDTFIVSEICERFAFLPRLAKTSKKRSLGAVYALLANTFSFALGLAIANMIPGIF